MVILPTEKRIDWTRPPVVVFSLIILNLLVFVGFQSNDAAVYEETLRFYQDSTLPEREWPVYVDFRLRTDDLDEQELEDQRHNLVINMAFDPAFDRFVQDSMHYYVNESADGRWQQDRSELRAKVNQLSGQAYGLATHQFSVINLFSYQFLHGDWMHLIGNMVFLLICGFAVEASLGSKRFLLFYLLGGMGAGLFFQLVNVNNPQPIHLVGASGSISAVMAMYVTLFRLKRIEFFYWLFVFVGYFRAPALTLLPLYIAMELGQWLIAGSDNNVAYSAHIGGFISGFGLIFLAQRFSSHAIDDTYLDQAQDIDHERRTLDRVYRAIADYQFEQALRQLDPLLSKTDNPTPLYEIKLNLIAALGGQSKADFFIDCIERNIHFDRLDRALNDWWLTLTEPQQLSLSNDNLAKVALRLIDADQAKASEAILHQLLDHHFTQPVTAKLARRLAHFYDRQGVVSQKTKMNALAEQLMQSGIHDHRTQL